MAVDHELVDVVVAQALQARVHALDDVLARQPALVRAAAHRHRDLRRQHVFVAPREVLQESADHLLAGADPVDVGAVEVEEAVVQRRLEDRPRLVRAERPVALVAATGLAEVHGAETQRRDAQAAQATELNGFEHG